jgi:hypothetical protein
MLKFIDPVPAVHLDLLVDDARRDGQARVGRDRDRHPPPVAVAAVDILVDAQVGPHRVDIAGDPVVVAHGPDGGRPAERDVEPQLEVAALAAAVQGAAAELGERLLHAQLGLIGDVSHRPRQRAGAEQRALWAAQDLDAVQVEQVEVRREQREGDHRFVQVDAHLLLDARLVTHDLAGGDAPHRDLALAGSQVLHRESAHVGGHALDVLDAARTQVLFGRRRHGEGHVVQRLLALQGGDRDLLLQLRHEREVGRHPGGGGDLEVLPGLRPSGVWAAAGPTYATAASATDIKKRLRPETM